LSSFDGSAEKKKESHQNEPDFAYGLEISRPGAGGRGIEALTISRPDAPYPKPSQSPSLRCPFGSSLGLSLPGSINTDSIRPNSIRFNSIQFNSTQ
jgi:hypothetical protein